MYFTTQSLNQVGDTYRGFTLTRCIDLEEIHCTLRELTHEATGAQVMHIGNDDPENLFCLSFRTLPDSSDGVAHILEHTVLCGSNKYPVKDPFFIMQRRSLNTFMNALTGADFTCYPAATQVPSDFYNLLEVYLDAVFHPNLRFFSFLQEGHRLEFEKPDDPKSPLQYKGIVFNEMKGALSSPSSRLGEQISTHIFPDLTYGHNSGGDPREIPNLSYQGLKDFHRRHYHPSRCLFYFYGNMPLEPHLDFILDKTLSSTEKVAPLSALPTQKRFTQPHYIQASFPAASEEESGDKAMIALAWLTCHILNQEDVLALLILEIILMDTDASPLKHALLKSGLCKQASAAIDTEISEVISTFVMKGCEASAADQIEQVIRSTLQQIVNEGMPDRFVESALHQLEIHRSEITGDGSPYGLTLFWRSALLRQHGGDPTSGLKIHSLFDAVRKHVSDDPNYFGKLIEKYYLRNPHYIRVVMVPDKDLGKKEEEEERSRLDKIRSNLTPQQEQQIVDTARDLALFQKEQEEQDLDVLPKVTLADVPLKPRDFSLQREQLGNVQLFHHDCFTNNIAYVDLVFPLADVGFEELPTLRLFTSLLNQVGCGGRTYRENLEYMQEHTGGVGAGLSLNLQASDHRSYNPCIHIQGKSLYRKLDKLLPLMRDMITSSDFSDVARLKELILKQYTGLESSINSNAMKYALNLSCSHLSEPGQIANQWYGLEYFWRIRNFAKRFDEQAEILVAKFKELSHRLLGMQEADLVITCDGEMYKQLKENDFNGLLDIPVKQRIAWRGNFTLPKLEPEGRLIASPVAFTASVLPTISYAHPDAAALTLASCILDNKTLHPKIREQGGAYGGGSNANSLSGTFSFYSYRDPNIASTFKAFESAVEDLLKGDFDEDDLIEAKLERIQGLDAPVAPGSRGEVAYSWWREGKTAELRQAFRDRVLKATIEDVINAVKKHVLPNLSQATPVVFAGKELLHKENPLLVKMGMKPLTIKSV